MYKKIQLCVIQGSITTVGKIRKLDTNTRQCVLHIHETTNLGQSKILTWFFVHVWVSEHQLCHQTIRYDTEIDLIIVWQSNQVDKEFAGTCLCIGCWPRTNISQKTSIAVSIHQNHLPIVDPMLVSKSHALQVLLFELTTTWSRRKSTYDWTCHQVVWGLDNWCKICP